MGKRIGHRLPRRHGAFVNHSGWSPSGDVEWRYRKTLDKAERDLFDLIEDGTIKLKYVNLWFDAGEPKEHTIKHGKVKL